MTRTDWVVSIYAGAALGGVFWLVLPIVTSLWNSDSSPHSTLLTVPSAAVVGVVGLTVYRATSNTTCRRVGAAISIGAIIGLPVLGWFGLW